MNIVYSKDHCPGCERLLAEYESNGYLEGQDFRVVKLGKDISVDEFLARYPDAKGVPYVVTELQI